MTDNIREIAISTPVDNEVRTDPNPDLVNALSFWQTNSAFIERVMNAVAPVMQDLKFVNWVALAKFATLMDHLESDASMLYHGKVLWHAAPNDVDLSRYNKLIITTCMSRAAAVAYGRRKYPRNGFTVHTITIATTKARGINVNAYTRNPAFAHDEEVIVKMVDYKLEVDEDDLTSWKLKAV
jgi:hypothetical protein